tara:strand:- start:55 stop:564 length:510 start_codon:yes stop_codon:yes gene_type:complete
MNPKQRKSLEIIKKLVETELDVNLNDESRERDLCYTRYIFYKLCKDFTFSTLAQIGSVVNKHHTSVVSGLKQFDNITFTNDRQYLNPYHQLRDSLESKFNTSLEGEKYFTMKDLIEQNILLKQQSEDLKLFIDKNLRDFLRKVKKTYGYTPFHAREKHRKLEETLKKIT